MRKLALVLVLVLLIASTSYGAVVATRISGNTISFSTVTNSWLTTPNVVTLNTITNKIRLTNLSTVADCYVDLRCVDNTGKSGYFTKESATLLVPAMGKASDNTVEIDFATKNIGFRSNTNQVSSNNAVSGSNNQLHYTLIGDWGDF
jgi:hypothetical protein